MFGAGYTVTNTGLFNGLATQCSANKFIYIRVHGNPQWRGSV